MTMTQDVQELAAALFDALGIAVPCGTVTLNMNDHQVDSVETKVKVRVPRKAVDKRLCVGASLTR